MLTQLSKTKSFMINDTMNESIEIDSSERRRISKNRILKRRLYSTFSIYTLIYFGIFNVCIFPPWLVSSFTCNRDRYYKMKGLISNRNYELFSYKHKEELQQRSMIYSNKKENGSKGELQALEKELMDVKLEIKLENTNKLKLDDEWKERLNTLSHKAFSHTNWRRQQIGVEVVQIQLYLNHTVLPSNILSSIRYLCKRPNAESVPLITFDGKKNKKIRHSILAFRLLQRLISGVGVSQGVNMNHTKETKEKMTFVLNERDICTVLNALVHSNQLNHANRFLLLQEQLSQSIDKSSHYIVTVPPVSAVGYSILIKAFGKKKNLSHVEELLSRAYDTNVEPDIIFLNSVVDAYIQCDSYEKANVVFHSMKQNQNNDLQPNTRTYNTIMKGLAKQGDVKAALKLSSEMERLGKYDAVSVNTLVNAMVEVGQFAMAESVLDRYVNKSKTKNQRQHPHVQAYTELLDGYAKANMLPRAYAMFDKMTSIGVTPNEITYTCLIHALGKGFNTHRARQLLLEQQHRVNKAVVMYNAYLTGLFSVSTNEDKRLKEAFSIFQNMMNNTAVKPNAVTAVTFMDGISKFDTKRINDGRLLIENIFTNFSNEKDITKVQTALLKAYSKIPSDNVDEIDDLFHTIHQIYYSLHYVDLKAMNAYLNACCRFRHFREAFQEFKIAKTTIEKHPDVSTYTILISALLTHYRDNRKAANRAQELYKEMRDERNILPDPVLVDIILYAMTNGGSLGLTSEDVDFTLQVLKDAKQLDWSKEEYKKRERMVNKVFLGRLSEVWKKNDNDWEEDEFLKRKGWNQVDSSFRLLGNGENTKSKTADPFLKSKGWNDVDSGFRII